MAASSLPQIGMSVPTTQENGEEGIIRQDGAVWIGKIRAGWSAGIWDSAMTETLTSVAELVE